MLEFIYMLLGGYLFVPNPTLMEQLVAILVLITIYEKSFKLFRNNYKKIKNWFRGNV